MCSLNSSNGDDRILDWLGSDCDGLSYHLHPLNLGWSREGVEHDLSVYRRVGPVQKLIPICSRRYGVIPSGKNRMSIEVNRLHFEV